jgi:hypothetical protein
MSAAVIPFPSKKPPVQFDASQPLHKLAKHVADRCGISFEQALGNCRNAFAMMRREEAERGR